jgi:methylated-DNA-protein-cysteine methyltransferase-like protein
MENKLSSFTAPVFELLKTIPRGKVMTYGLVAKYCKIKNPRNVGWILRQNDNPEAIPCYKVVLSNGKLAQGYKFGGRKEQKEKLEKDGIEFDELGKIKNLKNILFKK